MTRARFLIALAPLLSLTPHTSAQIQQAREFRLAVTSPNASWQDRATAFDRLLISIPNKDGGAHPWATLPAILSAQPDSGESLRLDLIQALSKEVLWSRSQPALTEEFTNYQGNLIAAVTSLRDPRSASVLFELIDSGDMALTALAGFGEPSLTRALELLNSPSGERIRHAALLLLAKIAQPGNASRLHDPAAKTALLDALTQSLRQNDYFTQTTAISGLLQLGDKRAIPALSAIAGREESGSVVRQQAQSAAAKLSER